MNDNNNLAQLFVFFNEVGIINQLASSSFERVMPEGLTQSQFSVLNNFVRLGGTRTPAQLASAFQVTRGAMTNTLGKLQLRGCVRIVEDTEDRRRKIVSITAKGKALRERAVKATFPVFNEIAGVLSEKDVNLVLPVLQRVRQYLDVHREK